MRAYIKFVCTPISFFHGEAKSSERDIVGAFCDLRDDYHVCGERTLVHDSLLFSVLRIRDISSCFPVPSQPFLFSLHVFNYLHSCTNSPHMYAKYLPYVSLLCSTFACRAHVKLYSLPHLILYPYSCTR